MLSQELKSALNNAIFYAECESEHVIFFELLGWINFRPDTLHL